MFFTIEEDYCMSTKTILYLGFTTLAFSCFFFVSPTFSEDQAPDSTTFEQGKTHIIENIETLLEDLHRTRGCVSGAKTSVELEQCRKEMKIRNFQEVQDKLSEMGMSMEERRMKKLLPEK